MAAVAAANQSELQCAALDPAAAASDVRPPATLDPQLLMASRRGNSKQLRDLLQLRDEDQQGPGDEVVAASTHVVVEVDPHPRGPHDDAAVAAPLPTHTEGGELLVVGPQGNSRRATAPHDDDDAALPLPVGLDEDGVTMEGDSLLHVLAACGDGDGEEYLQCAKMIVHRKKRKGGAAAVRRALEARNRKGDTPLHCAAAAGNARMIPCLIDLIVTTTDDDQQAFLRMQNECGETALHQAIRAANTKQQVACIDQLMIVDPELACIPCDDDGGASPLYLAISLGEIEIARHLYVKSKGNLSYSGPDGRNVLHAAVHRGQALPMILKWLKPKEDEPANVNVQGELQMSGKRRRRSSVSLVLRLTSQRDTKQKGSTPLHLAASLARWPYARLSFPQTARLLLDANESTAYQADDEGSYPIHVAAWGWDPNSIRPGSRGLGVVKQLLERCPDCATLRDGKGRTFLHVAAEKQSLGVVRYVVSGEMRQGLSSMILNAQDSNGDTALHGAVRAGNLAVFNCLFRNRQVRLDVANKDGMTPLDLSLTLMIPVGFNYVFNPRSIVHTSLLHAGAPHGGGRPDLFFAKHRLERDLDKESKHHTEATQVMSIVTALIATVTFASAFTFPGGYRAQDGEPVLAGSYVFDAFILADTLAFICSISATLGLVYAGVPAMDISIRFRYLRLSTVLMRSAAMSLVAAFGLGLYLVVTPFHHTASKIATCATVVASLLYGNIEVWQIIRMATTVLARTGIRRHAVVRHYAIWIFTQVLISFWSFAIIFGLPAIRKGVKAILNSTK